MEKTGFSRLLVLALLVALVIFIWSTSRIQAADLHLYGGDHQGNEHYTGIGQGGGNATRP